MVPLSIPSSSSSLTPFTNTLTLTLTTPVLRRSLYKPTRRPSSTLFSSPSPPISPIRPLSSSLLPVEDLIEKDWSFLESSSTDSEQSRIIAAAEIREDSRVLVSFGTVGFVDRVVDSSPCELLVAIHDSLFVLAMIKEKHDEVRCWKGEIHVVPGKFLPFDVVFVCYFPGMGVSIDQLLRSVAERCSSGARLVISFDQGREIIERDHRQQYPDMVTSDLPDRISLEKAATDHSFQITEFVDEPTLYLAVLKFYEPGV